MPFFREEIISLGLTDSEAEQRSVPFDNPAISLAAPASPFFEWTSDGLPLASGVFVSQETAMRISTVFACVRILAESVASLPVYMYERDGAQRKLAYDHPAYQKVAVAPNPIMSVFTFYEALMMNIVTNGNGYAEIEWANNGQVFALWPRLASKTTPKIVEGKLWYETRDTPTGETRMIPAEDMIHVPALAMNGLVGMSPIQQARQALGLALATERHGASYFGNASRPSGILSTPRQLTEKARAANRDSWERLYSGANSSRTAILDEDLKFTPIYINHSDAQFLETRNYQKLEIIQIYRVPPHMVGIMDKGTAKANIEQQSQDFISNTLRPYVVRIEQAFQAKLLPSVGRSANKYFMEFSLDAILRADFLTRWQGYATGRQWGILSINDCRYKEGLNPLAPKIGDQYMVPLNMIPADKMDNQAQPHEDDGSSLDVTDLPEDERMMQTRTMYVEATCDAIGRYLHHDKRDFGALERCLGPILRLYCAAISMAAGRRGLKQADVEAQASAVVKRYLAKCAEEFEPGPRQKDANGILIAVGVQFSRELAAFCAHRALGGNTNGQSAA